MIDLRGDLRLEGDLRIEAPGGGTLLCNNNAEGDFVVNCSDAATAREAFSALRSAYPPARRFRFLGEIRNPLGQEIDLRIGDRRVLRWPVGKLPRITSLRGVVSFLRGR